MSNKSRNPHYYYIDENKCATDNMKLAWYIFDNQNPEFLARREKVTLAMVKEVTRIFNYCFGEDQRWEQLDVPLKLTYSQYHDSFKGQHETYDTEYVLYKKNLKLIEK